MVKNNRKIGVAPKASVLMSVYNSEKYLKGAIRSIIEQEFNDFEFIIVDDGSTDNSSEIIDKFCSIDKRIKVISDKERVGLPGALNKGIKQAKGDYIIRQDADDISLKTRLKDQIEFLENNRNVFLAGGSFILIDEQGKHIRENLKKQKRITEKDILGSSFKQASIMHPSIAFRNDRKTFYREKFFYSQDIDFYLNLLSRGKILYNISPFVIKYRSSIEGQTLLKKYRQKLFSNKAKEFYRERKLKGVDGYSDFDANKIMGAEVPSEYVHIIKIKEFFNTNQMTNTRVQIRKYWDGFGFKKWAFSYYVASFLPSRVLTIFRKLIFG